MSQSNNKKVRILIILYTQMFVKQAKRQKLPISCVVGTLQCFIYCLPFSFTNSGHPTRGTYSRHGALSGLNEEKCPLKSTEKYESSSRPLCRHTNRFILWSVYNVATFNLFVYLYVPENCSAECLALIRRSLKSPTMASQGSNFEGDVPHIFVTLGASVRNTHEQNFKYTD